MFITVIRKHKSVSQQRNGVLEELKPYHNMELAFEVF